MSGNTVIPLAVGNCRVDTSRAGSSNFSSANTAELHIALTADNIEDPVPNRSGTGSGGGNGDRIQDNVQAAEALLPILAGISYVTPVSQSGKTLINVTTVSVPDDYAKPTTVKKVMEEDFY